MTNEQQVFKNKVIKFYTKINEIEGTFRKKELLFNFVCVIWLLLFFFSLFVSNSDNFRNKNSFEILGNFH